MKPEVEWAEIYPPKSRPARGAWIETRMASICSVMMAVAPRAGRVD